MQQTPLPTATSFSENVKDRFSSEFVIEPLYPGYGRTVGNALRRVLLSSLSGTAITNVKLEGVNHEFSAIPHVKEDIVDILLNLKLVHIACEEVITDEAPVKLSLTVDGAKNVVAGDFEKRSGVTIMNPKFHLATLTDDAARIEMTVTLGQGRGYYPIELRPDAGKEIGMIALDAIYTPVLAVGYHVESVRVGQMTNWDRVLLTVTTNGVVTPREALQEASKILVQQFGAIVNFMNESNADTESAEVEEEGEEKEEEEKEEQSEAEN